MTTHKHPDPPPPPRDFKSLRILICTGLLVAIALQLTTRIAVAADQLVQPVTLNISETTSLEDALIEWGRQAGITVMIDTRAVNGQLAHRVHGTFSTGDALKMLLRNSGLTYTQEGQIVHIIPTNKRVRLEESGADLAGVSSANSDFDTQSSRAEASDSVDNGTGNTVEEVLVTAQKNGATERLQDVPVPISVISAQSLMQANQAQIQDYFNQIPGLSIAQSGNGQGIVSIRGITTGENTNPTVGFTLDDVPMGGSTNGGSVGQVPIINPADLAQVEVLRGPQGTLYGANSMGGLIRYVTVDPSTDKVFGDVQAGGDSVVGGTHLGYNISAAVNVPLTDTVAMRASAFSRLDPGYIDNVEIGYRGINTTKSGGGRIAAMWTPSSDLSIKLSGLYEKTDRYGSSDVDLPTAGSPQTTGLGDLQQYDIPGSGYYDQEFKTTNLTVNANLAGVKLTSISGYTTNGYVSSLDYTSSFSNYPFTFGAPLINDNQLHKFSQEIRLTDTIGSHIEWLVGGFYTQEDNRYLQHLGTVSVTTGATVGVPNNFYYVFSPGRYREYAGYGALTWKIVDRFDIQFGGRETYISEPPLDQGSYTGGIIYGEPPGPSVYSPPNSSYYRTNKFTYLVSPRFKLSPDVMIYARVASGFRPGSGTSNPEPTNSCVIAHEPCQINSDNITNYEVGVKSDFFDHLLSIDSSVYYIGWNALQVNLIGNNQLEYFANGAGAKSQGVDLSVQWKPLEGLTISGWGAWNQSVLTQTFASATSGQPLPYAARFSSNLSVTKDVLITTGIHAFFATTEVYVGDRTGEFTSIGAPRQDLPAYAETNVNGGIKDNLWTFNLYVRNATDRRGLLYGGINATFPFAYDYITPRTIGLSVDRTF